MRTFYLTLILSFSAMCLVFNVNAQIDVEKGTVTVPLHDLKSGENYVVQVAAFIEKMPLSYFTQHSALEGIYVKTDQNQIHRYFLGQYETQEEADYAKEQVIAAGFTNAQVIDLEEQERLCSMPCNTMDKNYQFVSSITDNLYLRAIFFDFDRSFLRSKSKTDLDNLYQMLVENPQYNAELHAHTDSKGTNDYNMRLSQRRANAAKNYLIKRGIAASRLRTRIYGESDPIAKNDVNGNDSPQGRQFNRRVVMVMVDSRGEIVADGGKSIDIPAHLKK